MKFSVLCVSVYIFSDFTLFNHLFIFLCIFARYFSELGYSVYYRNMELMTDYRLPFNAKKHRETHRQTGKQAQAARFNCIRFLADNWIILLHLAGIYHSMTPVNATSEGFELFMTNYFESKIIWGSIVALAYLLIAYHLGWLPFKKCK